MQKKIETMVLGIGELSLDAISTWFPSKDKDTIAKAIETSEVIGLKGTKVMPIKKIQELESKEASTKKINLVPENKVVKPKDVVDVVFEKVEEPTKEANVNKKQKPTNAEKVVVKEGDLSMGDISLTELQDIINKYNRRVKLKYEMLRERNFFNIKNAIINYYEVKFNVVDNTFPLSGGAKMYSLVHKKSKIEMAYLFVGELLTLEDFDSISKQFPDDTVYFCITKDAEVLPNISDREYYLKDVDKIVNKYLDQFTLEEIDTKLYKIN